VSSRQEAARAGGILARGLTRHFGDLTAAREVTFSVAPGEIVGLLGPNGAGKTTTLRMLATLLQPSGGEAWVAGHDVRAAPLAARRRLGYLTGDTGLYGRLSPREILAYFGALHGLSPHVIATRTAALTERLGLGAFLDRPCEKLSTGQRQRTSIARALVHDPPVLLLDEATSGLDILAARDVLGLLRAEVDTGKAALLSTHILAEVELVCDRAVILHHGEVRHDDTLEALARAGGAASLSAGFFRLLGEEDAS